MIFFLFTGVTRAFYRRLNKGLEQIIDWRCDTCRSQVSINVQARNNTLELTAESTLEVAPASLIQSHTTILILFMTALLDYQIYVIIHLLLSHSVQLEDVSFSSCLNPLITGSCLT